MRRAELRSYPYSEIFVGLAGNSLSDSNAFFEISAIQVRLEIRFDLV
jgi:hypothetical protein